ncbi:MAG: ketopantoate reductase family protein [Rhodospirillaceae bacterium]|jgi:2-dehydropantoate 2-reductase|nr:ketopantoate reductase family protein [Rhodospirillaceae bacterium]MBT5243194.1 ketopantoate reductase family protein [Rhodospirillaceae bacterium]MBT6243733.1 ketopantoate reductase family protein [Rhodospirillaceae bacterium]MBT7942826.1 ketopantoate reductase family protein [Alphaproteobacteria bacterium]
MPVDQPSIVIVGAGAMGSLFGGLLAEGGLDVTLLDIWREHVETINENGLRIVGYGGERVIPVKATSDAATIKAADVFVFQCKALSNEDAANSVKHLFLGETAAVSFQNGLGNEEVLGRVLGPDKILAGLTAQGAVIEAPGVVRNHGDLPTYLGEIGGGLSARASAIAEAFNAHGLPTEALADVKRAKWKKLLGNIGFSAVSGTTDLNSIAIMAVPEMKETVFRAVAEAAAVARACGIDLSDDESREILMKMADVSGGGTGTTKSSLCTDLTNHRPTEVDFIYGTVARLGRDHQVPTPTLDTLISIVKGLESHYLANP